MPFPHANVPGDFIVQKAGLTANGSQLFDEPGHLDDDLCFRGVEAAAQFLCHTDESCRIEAVTVLMKQHHEAAHVGATHCGGEVGSEGYGGRSREETAIRVPDGNRIAQPPYANTLNADVTMIRLALGIFHGA